MSDLKNNRCCTSIGASSIFGNSTKSEIPNLDDKEHPDVLQVKREVATVKLLIGYESPLRISVKNSRMVCVSDMVKTNLVGTHPEFAKEHLKILNRFNERVGNGIGKINSVRDYLNSVIDILSYYDFGYNVMAFALYRPLILNATALRSTCSETRKMYIKEYRGCAIETIVNLFDGNCLEELLYYSVRKPDYRDELQEAAKIKKELDLLESMLYTKIGYGVMEIQKEGTFNYYKNKYCCDVEENYSDDSDYYNACMMSVKRQLRDKVYEVRREVLENFYDCSYVFVSKLNDLDRRYFEYKAEFDRKSVL